MNMAEKILKQMRLSIAISVVLTLVGVAAIFVSAKEEDPKLAERWGVVRAVFAGADPASIERLVVKPVEDELKQIDDIKRVSVSIRPDFALIEIELKDATRDIEKSWNEVRDALDRAQDELPLNAQKLELDRHVSRTFGILLALTNETGEPEELINQAEGLKRELLRLPGTSQVEIHGDPKLELVVEIDAKKLDRYGVSKGQILRLLQEANTSVPGGTLNWGDRRVIVKPNSRLISKTEVENLAVPLAQGDVIRVSDLAQVSLKPQEPRTSISRFNGKPAVVVAVSPQHPIDVIDFGKSVRSAVASFSQAQGVSIHELTFQPDRTEQRLWSLFEALVSGILSVAFVLVFWVGVRMGLIVSISVPVISLIGLALYFSGGGILHQISLAAFVISLGQFIDNLIVVTESIQRRLNEGIERFEAGVQTVQEFAMPMVFATGTAIASFVPMLAAQGATAEFTFAIPLIATITLLVSYVFAIFVVPAISIQVLQPQKESGQSLGFAKKWPTWATIEAASDGLASFVIQRPKSIIIAALGVTAICAIGFTFVRQEFFPKADRNEFVVRLELPDGSPIAASESLMALAEKRLLAMPQISQLAAFVGQGTPLFYYNLSPGERTPHLGEFLVVTKTPADNLTVEREFREWAEREILSARVTVLSLEQGPPVAAPIELRVQGERLEDLFSVAQEIQKKLRSISGAQDPFHDQGVGIPALGLVLSDVAGARHQLSRQGFAVQVLSETSGIEASRFSGLNETIPLRLRTKDSANKDVGSLMQAIAAPTADSSLRLSDVATAKLAMDPAVLSRRDAKPLISVFSYLQPGAAYSDVMRELEPWLAAQTWPKGVDVKIGGQAEGSGEANLSIFRAVPLGVIILLACLLLEFNSFRKIGLIVAAMPLAISGIVPGLLVGSVPFGFMSLLGVLALIGILVNNAILLLESIENLRGEGRSIEESIRQTLKLRTKPILLTAVLTVVGLLPLAFDESTLWPPLAWTMISGLLASTALTLAFIPAAYLLVFSSNAKPVQAKALGLVFVLIFSFSPGDVFAAESEMNVIEVMRSARSAPEVKSAQESARSESFQTQALNRQSFAPKVAATATLLQRSEQLNTVTPFGAFPNGRNDQVTGGIEIRQPILNISQMKHQRLAQKNAEEASKLSAERTSQLVAAQAGQLALATLSVQRTEDVLLSYEANLKQQLREVERLSLQGRLGQADVTRVRLELGEVSRARASLRAQRSELMSALKRFVPGLTQISSRIPESLLLRDVNEGGFLSENYSREHREDRKALQLQIQAQEQSVKAVETSTLPFVEATGRWVYADQGLLQEKSWGEVAVTVTWPLFQGGAAKSQASAERARLQALKFQEEVVDRGQAAEIEGLRAKIVSTLQNLASIKADARLSEQSVREERGLYRRQRRSVTDWLKTERQHLDLQRSLIEAETELAQAVIALKLESGSLSREL